MDFEKIKQELTDSQVKSNKYIGISPTTVKNYVNKLKLLQLNEVTPDKMVEYIKTKYTNNNSRNANQIAITGTAKHSPYFKEYIGQDVLDAFVKENEKTMSELRGNPNKQQKTEQQEANWIDLKDLKALFKEKRSEFNTQDQILISMYILMPPARLDYHNIKIVRGEFINPETNLPDGIIEKQNYLKIFKKRSTSAAELILKEYKTSATYGDQINKIPKAITDLILQLPVTTQYLFEKKAGGPFSSPETYAVYLRNIFNKLTGKNLSVDLLRSIYITDFRKGEKSTLKKQELARKMMNSVTVQDNYLKIEN